MREILRIHQEPRRPELSRAGTQLQGVAAVDEVRRERRAKEQRRADHREGRAERERRREAPVREAPRRLTDDHRAEAQDQLVCSRRVVSRGTAGELAEHPEKETRARADPESR
jgi:hypothetical protein